MSLFIVAAPPGPASSSAIDIVAVHGLGGDAIATWTHAKSKAFWLKDFLPQQIPDARIMTFGYNADAAFGQSTAEITDYAKSLLASLVDKREEPEEIQRPLIFVAHSLGGIVVKQALFQARLESRYQSIKDSTLGLIFLGTPHRGSGKATYGKVLANVAQFLSHRPPQRLLTALQTNSDVLLRLTTDFRFQLPDYEVYSFFELRPMKGLSSLIVEKHSALLETNHEEQIPVDADHSAICKFEMESDDTFEKVYKRMKRIRNNPRRVTPEQLMSHNQHFEVPHLLSPIFTGREDDLQLLTAALLSVPPFPRPHQRRFVLFGLGGSGKTQLCLKYVQDQRERYWGIFWVDASTDQSIQQSFTQVARILQVEESVDSVRRRLAHASDSWLLVFDNADDPRLQLSPYFPTGSRGDVIITSRNPQCQHYNTTGFRYIGQLAPDDSLMLLSKVISSTTIPSPDLVEESTQVVKTLGHLALAIVQAGAYIRETSCSLHDYLDIYEQRKRIVLDYLPQHVGTDYQHSVYTTWQVSVDMITSRQDATSRHALRLLSLLGFYHHDQVPVQMFYNAWYPSQRTKSFDYLPWDDTISDFLDYQQAVQASITLLASFSLITRNKDPSVSLHPLVQEWCRDQVPAGEERQVSYQRALTLLARSVTWEFATKDYSFRRSLVFHVHELLRFCDKSNRLSEENKIQWWPTLALILTENGWTTDALPLMEEVLRLHRSKLGADHPDTLNSMHNLAIRYSEAGRRAEALQLTEEVVALHKSKLGADHPDTLRSMGNLAIWYSEAGRRAEALQLTEEVVALHKSKLGADHLDTLRSMHNLAIWYSEAGRRAEALQLTEEVVALRKSKLGADHPDTLASMHNLAIRYSEAGRRAEALQLTEEVVALRKSKLGADHPDTLASMNYLAIRYSDAGRRAEALQLTEEVLVLQKSKLGADHPNTLASMHNLAIWYSEAGRGAEALQLTEEVVALCKSKLRADHPDTLMSLGNLAIRYSEAGRRDEALQLTEEVLVLQKSKLGADHPDTLASMHNLAIRYSEAGRRDEALQLMEEVVALRKSKLGADHPDTLTSMGNLANRYSEAGRRDEALDLTEKVVALRKSKLGADHPDTLNSLGKLALRYREAGRRADALQLTEEVVRLRKSKLGADHPDTLASMHNLAIRNSEAGRGAEALQLMEEVVALRKSKLGADHPDTLGSMGNLAICYSEAGQRPEALQLMAEVVALRNSKLGADHPDTLASMNNLAVQYSKAGRRAEALQLMEEVVTLRKSKLGVNHPNTLRSMHNLAIWYSEAGRRAEALSMIQ